MQSAERRWSASSATWPTPGEALRDAEDELTAAERQAERARRRVAGLEDELDRARDTV